MKRISSFLDRNGYFLSIVDRYDDVVVSNFLMLIWRYRCVLQAGEKISAMGSVAFLTRYIDALYLARQQQPVDDSKGKQKCGMEPV
jgi:hypothetical protein